MAKLSVLKGATSVLIRIFIQDSTSTTGAGKTGLTNASFTGTKVYVARDDDGNAGGTSVSLTAGTRGTWSSGGIVEKDATNMPGVYEFGLTNASIATGSRSAQYLFIGTGIVPCPVEIELTNVDNQSASGGLVLAKTTNITGFNDIAATAIVSSGAITTSGGAVSTVTTTTTATNLTNLPAIPANWITAAGITAAALNGKGDWLTSGGTLATVTTLTNLPSIPANWITAAGITAGALNGKGDWPTLAGVLSTPRDMSAIADSSLTVNDALWAAIGGGVGQKDASSGTSMTIKTPSTATLLRTFTITTASAPTTVPTKIV